MESINRNAADHAIMKLFDILDDPRQNIRKTEEEASRFLYIYERFQGAAAAFQYVYDFSEAEDTGLVDGNEALPYMVIQMSKAIESMLMKPTEEDKEQMEKEAQKEAREQEEQNV